LQTFSGPWWVAGGWAIDLAIGAATRAHEDLDIAVLRKDTEALRMHLAGWDLQLVREGSLHPWNGGDPPPCTHQIWARMHEADRPFDVGRFAADPTFLEVLIEEHEDDMWLYRRDLRIRRPLRTLGRRREGIPFVAPDVQLLYKSKPHPKYDQKNDLDFQACLPHLTAKERAWLGTALSLAQAGHRWLESLR
jgi:hypothetical protein